MEAEGRPCDKRSQILQQTGTSEFLKGRIHRDQHGFVVSIHRPK